MIEKVVINLRKRFRLKYSIANISMDARKI